MEFHGPATVEEAVSLLAADEDARCLAGGATLVAMMNADLLAPSALVSLRHIEALRGISADSDGGLRVGAMTSHHDVANATGLDGAHALLAETARAIGHPAIRNMGTIGGSIGHGDPQADYPGALVALDAAIEVQGPGGTRTVAAEAFFVDYLETALLPGELIAAVTLPASPAGAFGAYEKFARVEGDYATVSVAAVVANVGRKMRPCAGRARQLRPEAGAGRGGGSQACRKRAHRRRYRRGGRDAPRSLRSGGRRQGFGRIPG